MLFIPRAKSQKRKLSSQLNHIQRYQTSNNRFQLEFKRLFSRKKMTIIGEEV